MKNFNNKAASGRFRKDLYLKGFEKYGPTPKALGYWNKKSMDIRYEALLKDLDIKGKTILDVGCGFGDLLSHLKKKTGDFDYLGVDIIPEFIKVAKNRYKDYRFLVADYFASPITKKFDIVITSGTLNSSFPKDPVEFRKKAIKVLFEHANKAIAFNMAGSHPQPENKKNFRVYYADSMEILKYCLTLTSKVTLRQNYLPKDFTILLLK